MERVRIGILGAARIVPAALLSPARSVPEVSVSTIAARDRRRAEAFARRHGIPRVRESYEALLADPDVDAIYLPLPNGLHCEWTIRALEAGKHVLCEKPFASNAAEAERMAEAANRSGRVLMEAFHYRYHPLAARMQEIVTSGVLGRIRHIETWMCIPILRPSDIRYRFDLAGGATMDAGTYAIHLLRFLSGAEPSVTRAQARLSSPQVDRWMRAEFDFDDGRSGAMTCALFSRDILRIGARVRGDRGVMRVVNFAVPQFFHRLSVETADGRRVIQSSRQPTYLYQLRAFARSVMDGTPVLTPPSDAIANMRVIDAVYQQAGLRLRGELGDR
jgi:predicted dehydrogenase